jgi:UDP-3-O-[3-hydroxymyristoyl] N-acetylglucosamine deacetylase
VLAALAGMELDNVLMEVNGPEVPILDGSSKPFMDALDKAGRISRVRKENITA